MNVILQPARERLNRSAKAVFRYGLVLKRLLREQFDKNIYTRILFTNVTIFLIAMTGLTLFAGHVVKEAAFDQAQQELMRKAKRINFALLQQTDSMPSGEPGSDGVLVQGRQELLKFLADVFDTRITVFNLEGLILDTSAEQEVIPGSKVEPAYVQILRRGEANTVRVSDPETGQPALAAVIPMGTNLEAVENGLLLEAKPVNVNLALNGLRLYLVSGGALVLVIIIFVSVSLAMSISRPISRLSTAVADISRGSYAAGPPEQSLDEINTLAGQLNQLAINIQKIQGESSRMEEERTRLFAEISHELRTPLTAVQGFVEAIRDGIVQDDALRKRYLDTIYTQTVHISRLVDDILVLSRLESGSITVQKLPLDLVALTEGVAVSMEAEAASRKTSLRLEKKTDQAVVIGDVDRMEQILRNLLKNALRATPNGTITMGVEKRRDEVLLTISDNGSGIPPGDLPHIWDRFYRVKNWRDSSRGEKGSGLGLVIVKKLVQLQGGKIEVASRLGEGTTFTISFPSFNENASCNIC